MLEEKTVGNRSQQESKLFEEILHQLRMQFTLEQSSPVAPMVVEGEDGDADNETE